VWQTDLDCGVFDDLAQRRSTLMLIESTAMNAICVTCGTQFSETLEPPQHCPICEDPRQFVGWDGQRWTTLGAIAGQYRNQVKREEENLHSIETTEKFAIGQRAYLVQTPEGNVLWDCIALIDEATIETVRSLGGIAAIAISHPHYYTTMVEWSRAFGNVPIYLHEDSRNWVMRPDKAIQFWSGDARHLIGGLTLSRTGGHFKGSQVLHSPRHASGRGALFAGDQPRVCMDRRWATFMYSYPNFIPLSPAAVHTIMQRLEPLQFDRLYAAVPGFLISDHAKAAVERSAERYLSVTAASS